MHKKIIIACMAIAVSAAFTVPVASAVHLREENTSGTTLGAGASVTATDVGDITITNGAAATTCPSAHMSGTVTRDEGGTVAVEIPAGNPVFTGTDSSGDCTSELGNVNWTVQSKLCLHIAANTDTGTVTGCGATITFTLTVTNVVTCKYQAASISAVVTTDPSPEGKGVDAQIEFREQEVAEEGGLFLCPDRSKLDMAFELTTTSGATLVFTAT